jgi:isopentenyldiphosphate isomerase
MKIPIVNTNDEITAYKDRSELDLDHDIVRSASLWITNSDGNVLLAQRKFDKRTDPGKWAEAVGGTVDNQDSYEDTVYREAEEELGIVGQKFTAGPKQFVTGPPANYFVQWYYVNLDWPLEKFVPQESEVERIAWWNPESLECEMAENPENYIDALPEMLHLLQQGLDSAADRL